MAPGAGLGWVAVFWTMESPYLLTTIPRTYQRIRFRSSTDRRRRTRKMATMMASPTATSAAATAITKKTRAWPSGLPQPVAEGHERQVRGVQHQLDRHEDDQRVAPDDDTDHADGKERRGEGQVVGGGDAHRLVRPAAAPSRSTPTIAASSSTEVSSNGNR